MIVFRCLSHSSFGAPPPPLPLPLLLPLQPVSSSYNSESITCLRTCCGSLILTLLRNVFEQLLQQLRDGTAQHVWPYKSMQLACFSILLPFVFFFFCCGSNFVVPTVQMHLKDTWIPHSLDTRIGYLHWHLLLLLCGRRCIP